MSDQAPVSSRHVKLKLFRLVNIPDDVLDKLEITTEITRHDRARTTVQRPMVTPDLHTRPDRVQSRWDDEMLTALRYLEGADPVIAMTMGRTFTVEWNGVCRPI